MATHSCILTWKIPCIEEHGRLQPMGSESDTAERALRHTHMKENCLGFVPSELSSFSVFCKTHWKKTLSVTLRITVGP